MCYHFKPCMGERRRCQIVRLTTCTALMHCCGLQLDITCCDVRGKGLAACQRCLTIQGALSLQAALSAWGLPWWTTLLTGASVEALHAFLYLALLLIIHGSECLVFIVPSISFTARIGSLCTVTRSDEEHRAPLSKYRQAPSLTVSFSKACAVFLFIAQNVEFEQEHCR